MIAPLHAHRFLAVIAATALAGQAAGSYCMPPPKMSLAEDVDAAASVYLGKVVSCADGKAPTYERCGDAGYRIVPTEFFKGAAAPWILPGSQIVHGCGLAPTVGTPVLIFADASGQPMAASDTLAGGRASTARTRARLEALRRVAAGDAPDLADPWIFGDSRINCGAYQPVGESRLGFSVFYANPQTLHGVNMTPVLEEDGNTVMKARPADPGTSGGPAGAPETGEKWVPRLTFSAMIDVPAEQNPGQGFVRVDGQEWPLERSSVARHRYPHYQIVRLTARPGDATAILDALLPAADVEVRFEPDSGDEPFVLRTRSTHLDPRDVERLSACIEGRHRGREFTTDPR